MSAPPLLARGLDCAVGGRTILRAVDLEVGAGSMVAVVGVNGAGKSTLLRTVAGLCRPVGGELEVHGADLAGMGARERARVIAFVAQEERPPADMRVVEFVALGRLPYRPPWSRDREDHRLAVEALARVDLAHHADRSCADLSGGERRRVSLARGLVQECDLLVLDEPTNHLDVRHQVELLQLLRDSGRTVLTAIHDLGLAASFFDQVVVLHDGRARPARDPESALTPQTVAEVFGVAATQLDGEGRRHLVVGPGRSVPEPSREPLGPPGPGVLAHHPRSRSVQGWSRCEEPRRRASRPGDPGAELESPGLEALAQGLGHLDHPPRQHPDTPGDPR